MKINRFFLVVWFVCALIYLIPELFFEGALLYLSGGIIGGTISEIIKNLIGERNDFFVFLIWAVLLGGLMFLFVRLQNKIAKYLVITVVAFFLYIIDNLLAFVPLPIDSSQSTFMIKIGLIVLSILLKGAFLAWLYCRWLQIKNNPVRLN